MEVAVYKNLRVDLIPACSHFVSLSLFLMNAAVLQAQKYDLANLNQATRNCKWSIVSPSETNSH